MKKILVVAGILLVACSGYAQTGDAAQYASMITGNGLQKHLAIIASEEMEGRETGTIGQRKAATYIESQFKDLGLKTAGNLNGYQQFYPLYRDSMMAAVIKVGDNPAVYGTDFIIPRLNSSGKFKANEIVFAGYGIEDAKYNDYERLNVKGRLVVIVLGEPKADSTYIISGTKQYSDWTFPGLAKKITLAANKGAAGVFIINPSQESFSQRIAEDSKKSKLYYPKDEKDNKVNYALVSHAFAKTFLAVAIDSIIKKAKQMKPFLAKERCQYNLPVEYAYEKNTSTVDASNVLGIVEGRDKKEEYVFVTAHYDHLGKHDGKIYYGADDDGSGTVAVIEMASAFAKAKAAGRGPRRTLVFMAVSGEEKGLWGSEYYTDHPVYPLDKTSVDLNIDMIGRIDTERKAPDTANYVYVVGHDKISSELPVINEGVNTKYTGLTLDYKFDDPKDPHKIYFRSDHYNFARKGVPVLFFYDGMLQADYHKPTDTIDKINWPLFEKRARMIFHTAWEMANRDELLKRDKPLPTETR